MSNEFIKPISTADKPDDLRNLYLLSSDTRTSYWDNYYLNSKKLNVPSQFAAFIANEFVEVPLVIDLGCGNGRDTQFFSYLGFNTIGIDGSESAINYCKNNNFNSDSSVNKNLFLLRNISELPNDDGFIRSIQKTQKIFYSRFFLHAINSSEESCFFNFINKSCRHDDLICLEFRTELDENRSKFTNAHYRRYINVESMMRTANSSMSLELLYHTEGLGLAKYKTDDAYVCRIIFKVK